MLKILMIDNYFFSFATLPRKCVIINADHFNDQIILMKKLITYDTQGKELSIAELKQIIESNIQVIEDTLTAGLTYYSQNARYTPGTLVIKSIELLHNQLYSMSYTYDWTIFNGCLDLNSEEDAKETVSFIVKPNGLEFDIIDFDSAGTENEL